MVNNASQITIPAHPSAMVPTEMYSFLKVEPRLSKNKELKGERARLNLFNKLKQGLFFAKLFPVLDLVCIFMALALYELNISFSVYIALNTRRSESQKCLLQA